MKGAALATAAKLRRIDLAVIMFLERLERR
jgi:hypothetical protein